MSRPVGNWKQHRSSTLQQHTCDFDTLWTKWTAKLSLTLAGCDTTTRNTGIATIRLRINIMMSSRHTWIHRVRALKRQAAGSSTIQAGSTPLEAAAPTAAANTSLYLGVGIGVGGALLLACVVVIVAIVRKRAEHKRALAELEHGGHTVEVAQAQHVRDGVDVPRPVTLARVGRLVPAHGKGGWGALGSNEEVNEPDLANHPARTRRRSYISLPKRIKQNGMQLKRLKHLSAIIESPRSRSAHSPTPEAPDLPVLPMSKSRARDGPGSAGKTAAERKGSQKQDDVFVGPSSPKPDVLPSFAIRSPGRYGVSFVEDSPNKAKRSHPVGALVGSMPGSDGDVFGQVSIDSRPPMHTRSISLGAHRVASQPPSGPVPPLPVIAPHSTQVSGARNGFCLSRMSASSQESSSSSVLVTSPILRGLDEGMNSPSLEQMVSEDDNASLKNVSQRQWRNPLVAAPRPIPDTSPTVPATAMAHQHKPSIRSNIARYSTDSQLSRQLSVGSVASSLNSDKNNRLSIPRLGTADRVSIRSVSSVGSFTNDSGIRKVATPRKVSRCSTTVSENGSPAERQKTGVLRDISGNAGTPSRQASSATQTSSRSSNGNPFQWDSAILQKPSALKGSPNARKGHKRQNCVRISTLTPQILGPPPSRPTSPSIMHGIEEEPTDFVEHPMAGLPFTRLSRPPSATAFAPHLRISTLRASLTASSPTLSSWTTFQDPGLPSQPSDDRLAVSASPGTVGARSASRQSGQSSNFSIPSFPSPSKTTVTAVQRDQPVPEFYFTRPSTDEEPSFDFGWGDRSNNDPPPYDVHVSNDVEIPSSPPLPVAKESEYDPACPMLVIPKRDGSQEYDPASPAFGGPAVEHNQSSPSYASTVTFSDDTERYSRPVSYSEECHPESPPCSPKSMPQDLGTFSPSSAAEQEEEHSASSTPRATLSSSVEKLTSANASTIMARIRTHSKKVDFPGAPILSPPIDDNPVPFPLNTSSSFITRNRSASSALYLQPHRPAPQPPLPSSNATGLAIPSSLLPGAKSQSPTSSPISPESPSRRSPSGPRCAPAKPIAKQIVALRRMNSEMDTSTSHQTRRYIHGLSREPAPLLPWIGSTEQSDSCNDMFDFDFGSTPSRDAHGGALEGDSDEGERSPTSALDNVDLSDIERRLEGALAGFDVPVSPTVDHDDEEDCVAKPSHLALDSCPKFAPKSSPSPFQHEQENEECDRSRSSSVWEDGEKFWDRTSLSTIPGSSPSDAEKARALAAIQTPRVYGSPLRGLGGARRVSQMRPVSGIMATPRSLYDADGFLKT